MKSEKIHTAFVLGFHIFSLFILSFEGRFLVGCVRDLEYVVNKHNTTSTLEKRRGCRCEGVCGCVRRQCTCLLQVELEVEGNL